MTGLKLKVAAGSFAAAVALSTFAGTAFAASENANNQACFGQGRAAFASANGGPGTSNGFHISQRKGENPEINAAYRDACQAQD